MRTISLLCSMVPFLLPSICASQSASNHSTGVPNSCVAQAEAMFLERFPQSTLDDAVAMPRYLSNAITNWGPLVEAYAEQFVIRTTNDPNFISASIAAVGCSNVDDRSLVVIGNRLSYFLWRSTMLSADYWELNDAGQLEGRINTPEWPPARITDDLADAVLSYLGAGDLEVVDFRKFNTIVFDSHPVSGLLAAQTAEMAELFIVFHEMQHVLDQPMLSIDPDSLVPRTLSLPANRREQWGQELLSDVEATYLLWLAGVQTFSDTFGLDITSARLEGAKLAFSGADITLEGLSVLERIQYGDLSIEQATRHADFDRHPPAEFRRNILSQVMQALVLEQFGQADWNAIAENVGNLSMVRRRLFEDLFKARPDVIGIVK